MVWGRSFLEKQHTSDIKNVQNYKKLTSIDVIIDLHLNQ